MGYAYGFGYGHTWRNAKRRVEVAGSGGGALLTGEVNGFATDFLYSDDTKRVALKASSALTYYPVDGFYQNAGTSPKMVYDVAGVLVWSPHNLVVQSADFSGWDKIDLTYNSGTGKLTEGSTNGLHLLHHGSAQPTSVAGETYTGSWELKAGERTWACFELNLPAAATITVNLATGVAGTITGSPVSTSIVALAGGWYRISITVVAGSAQINPALSPATGNGAGRPSYQGDGASGIFARNSQINRGTTPTAYLPTTGAARVGLALDYDPVTHAAKGLLCEPQATNLMINSSNLDSWTVSGAISCTPNTTVSPTGAMDADTVNLSATPTDSLYQSLPLFAGVYTVSIFAKTASGTKQFRLRLYDGVEYYTPDFTATTTWQRFSAQITIATSVSGFFSIHTNSGGTAGSVIAYGAQCESGTVATSYIPTLGATVTRAGDNVTALPAAIGLSATTGTWWIDTNILRLVPGGFYNRVIGYSSNFAPIFMSDSAHFTQYDTPGFVGGVAVPSVVGSHKISSALQSGNWALTADGLAATTVTTVGALTSPTLVGFGLDPTGGGVDNMHGYIRQLRYVPRRKTSLEQVTETT